MYVRDARNRDEAWLLDGIEAMGLDETAFRSRDYVVAVDDGSDTRAGFGRLRYHPTPSDPEVAELTSIGVLEGWRNQGVGAHVIERLVDTAEMEGFDEVYSLTGEHDYLSQFGFRPVETEDLPEPLRDRLESKRAGSDPDAIPMVIDAERFRMPEEYRERFKRAAEATEESAEPEESAEDFGIDPDEATYKYDTG
ncbi:GNAT family N-acetyltransferase [Haloglomus irregulare]|jgi:N-acetylglutamate synthase-like GNAT family acetyltransferase|uniref:GNAT family N-acetyltransferase n=1 Tax=Haloglomus irregulare TaxID=2234134 RepID=A0A554MUV8_9EURY|nr:GNAT family N-acetyltransferase [Haloglomus irregulare]TSD08938.1 GNAT family N-acetyltransferase [Haloglomus irregulare]